MAGTAFESAEFFETCAMLITFICLGKYLECAAKGKTSAAIAALMGLAPPTALLLTLDSDGKVNLALSDIATVPWRLDLVLHRHLLFLVVIRHNLYLVLQVTAEEELPTSLVQRADILKVALLLAVCYAPE